MGFAKQPRSCPVVRLSKIEDYLADNHCVSVLSLAGSKFKKKVNGLPTRFPTGDLGTSPNPALKLPRKGV
jgi:hypothetical protein